MTTMSQQTTTTGQTYRLSPAQYNRAVSEIDEAREQMRLLNEARRARETATRRRVATGDRRR